MKKKWLMIISSLALASVLAACGDTEEKEKVEDTVQETVQEENHAKHEVAQETQETQTNEENNLEETVSPSVPTAPITTEQPSKPETEPKTASNNEIKNSEDAINYFTTQKPEFADQDTVILEATPEANADENGSYYLVKISSKAMRDQGGTGTVGFFKVYIDGTIESNY